MEDFVDWQPNIPMWCFPISACMPNQSMVCFCSPSILLSKPDVAHEKKSNALSNIVRKGCVKDGSGKKHAT